MSLECVVNKSLQTLLDDETEYGMNMTHAQFECSSFLWLTLCV